MSFGNGKISGHSGTEFKHRKAFTGIKAHRKRWQSSVNKEQPSDTVSWKEVNMERTAKKWEDAQRALLFLIPILIIANFLVWKYDDKFGQMINEQYAARQDYVAQQKALRVMSENDAAYDLLTRSGKLFLKSGSLDYAQKEFIGALKLYPYGKEANIGLTKVLVKKCELCQMYCEEAEQYLAFIATFKEVKLEDIKAVEEYAFVGQ